MPLVSFRFGRRSQRGLVLAAPTNSAAPNMPPLTLWRLPPMPPPLTLRSADLPYLFPSRRGTLPPAISYRTRPQRKGTLARLVQLSTSVGGGRLLSIYLSVYLSFSLAFGGCGYASASNIERFAALHLPPALSCMLRTPSQINKNTGSSPPVRAVLPYLSAVATWDLVPPSSFSAIIHGTWPAMASWLGVEVQHAMGWTASSSLGLLSQTTRLPALPLGIVASSGKPIVSSTGALHMVCQRAPLVRLTRAGGPTFVRHAQTPGFFSPPLRQSP